MFDCQTCDEIIKLESQIDNSANLLTQWVLQYCKIVDDWNNDRWVKFANICKTPVLGSFYQKRIIMPGNLEKRPEYWNEQIFVESRELIEVLATELEKKKFTHMEHWGEEIVSPLDPTDPGGYYSPRFAYRKDCYEHNLFPSIPAKFDFNSMAGSEKLNVNLVVMCSVTKRIVPMNFCDWESFGDKIKYKLSKLNSYQDPTIPDFNEWRNDGEVASAIQKKKLFDMLTSS
jgi:hypothetical protein